MLNLECVDRGKVTLGSDEPRAPRLLSAARRGTRALRLVPILLSVLLSMTSVGCYWQRVGAFPLALAETALVTAAIVSTVQPPPPRIVYVPEPRPGYAWQPGYWTEEDDQWAWVEGQWIALQPGYAWSPAHWKQLPDATWQLVPGHWVAAP